MDDHGHEPKRLGDCGWYPWVAMDLTVAVDFFGESTFLGKELTPSLVYLGSPWAQG